jgi:hypothetical protein
MTVGGGLVKMAIWPIACAQGKRSVRGNSESLRNKGDFAVFLTTGPDDNPDVLAKSGEKVHEALDGKGTGTIAHQGRDVRLLDAENFSSFGLLEAAFFDKAVNLQREPGFQEFLFGMGQTEVGKNIATAFLCLDGSFCSHSHVSFAFLREAVRHQPGGASPAASKQRPIGTEHLTLDSNDLPRLNGFDVGEAGGHEWQQVFQTVRLRMENDNCDFSGS